MDRLYWFFSGILVFVGAAGVYLAYRTLKAIQGQLNEIKRAGEQTDKLIAHTAQQAEAAKTAAESSAKNAESARLNAQAVINSERPWVFIKLNEPVQNPRETQIKFTAINRGRTPAEVTLYTADFIFAHPESLASIPTYPLAGHELAHKKYLPQGDSFEVYEFDCRTVMESQQWSNLNQPNQQGEVKRFVFIGHVLYRDLITREEHETRFCYWLSPAPWIGLIVGGPPEYNKHT